MSLQTIYVTKRGLMKVKNRQLVIEGHSNVHIPIEDITTVVIESQQVTITSACLSLLAAYGCQVIICDDSHTPNALQLPFLPHSRQAIVNRHQILWDEPFKKRCHQRIIQCKVANQVECCRLLDIPISKELTELSRLVKLGDKTNVEAKAANLYFAKLLKGKGRRDRHVYHNKALNYGYAIIRSQIAQALTAGGFIPSVGLFHMSELNNYNLADDMIEPFRPFVDYHVFRNLLADKTELDKYDKCHLLKLPEMELLVSKNTTTILSQSIKDSVQSLRKASKNRDATRLHFPFLCKIRERSYE